MDAHGAHDAREIVGQQVEELVIREMTPIVRTVEHDATPDYVMRFMKAVGSNISQPVKWNSEKVIKWLARPETAESVPVRGPKARDQKQGNSAEHRFRPQAWAYAVREPDLRHELHDA